MNISLDDEIQKDKEANKQNKSSGHSHKSNHHHHYRDERRDRNKEYNSEQGFGNQGYNSYSGHNSNNSVQQKTVIKITNLHYAVTKEQLQGVCQKFGQIKTCKIDWDKMGRSNETASVEYLYAKDAQNAESGMSQMEMEGQKIEVTLSYPQRLPPKRHIIHKNYSSRYNRNNSNKPRR